MQSNVKGFTLLEAIVAMVIISVLSMSLYSWLNVSYVSSTRAIETLNKSDVVLSARAFVEKLNPMEQPEGSYEIGEYFILWSSDALTEIAPVYNDGNKGLFDVALYKVNVKLYLGEMGSNQRLVGEYATELIGYSKVRSAI